MTTRRLALLLPLVAIFGCGSNPPGPAPLRIAAASDLQEALPILISAFKGETGLDAEPVLGASGNLKAQIEQGAPFDLFLSANRAFVDDLARSGAVRPDSVRPYARGNLVLAVNELLDPGIKSLGDLASDKVKAVAIANPDVAPYGAAARDALEKAGLWDKLKPKLVIVGSVRDALEAVRAGNADAGLVGRSIAGVGGIRIIPLAPDSYAPIVQAMGVVAASKRGDDAARFAQFLLGATGQGILRDLGFASPPDRP